MNRIGIRGTSELNKLHPIGEAKIGKEATRIIGYHSLQFNET